MIQARFFFQQLISGVSYCHAMVIEHFPLFCSIQSKLCFTLHTALKCCNICNVLVLNIMSDVSVLFIICLFIKQVCHRDLKLENTLLDGSPAPRLKICDFGYSKVRFYFSHLIFMLWVSCFHIILLGLV